jgi:hypothetical protein
LFEFCRHFQSPQCVVPHPFEHCADRAKRLAPGAISTMAAVGADVDESRSGEVSELERHRAKRNLRHGGVDISGSELLSPDQPQNLAPAR